MMGWLESRIQVLEQRVESLYRRLLGDEQTLANVRQQLKGAYQQLGGGGGGGGTYYACTLSAALAHGSSVTGQTVWTLSSGARTNVSTNATVYNDGPNAADDIPSGSQAILAENADGTYTATGVYC